MNWSRQVRDCCRKIATWGVMSIYALRVIFWYHWRWAPNRSTWYYSEKYMPLCAKCIVDHEEWRHMSCFMNAHDRSWCDEHFGITYMGTIYIHHDNIQQSIMAPIEHNWEKIDKVQKPCACKKSKKSRRLEMIFFNGGFCRCIGGIKWLGCAQVWDFSHAWESSYFKNG